jgi:hypothetical protein
MVTLLYLHYPTHLHGVVLHEAQEHLNFLHIPTYMNHTFISERYTKKELEFYKPICKWTYPELAEKHNLFDLIR